MLEEEPTIIDDDEETNERLFRVSIATQSTQHPLRLVLGGWAAKGLFTWDSLQFSAYAFGLAMPVLRVQEAYIPLINWMVLYRLGRDGPANSLFLWRAQQSYRIIQLCFTAAEQESILCSLSKQNPKISQLQG